MLSESLRLQLEDSEIQLIELVPPAVRTTLMNQQDSPHAMPLDEYVTEVLALLDAEPDAPEILVQRVLGLRYAERDGNYGQIVSALNPNSNVPAP